MKLSAAWLVFIAILILACNVLAEDVPPAPVNPPPPGGMPGMSRSMSMLRIGPVDMLNTPREIWGKLSIVIYAPRNIQATSFEVFLDNQSIGARNEKPYMIEFDASNTPIGEHVLKAIGKDASGNEVWTASTKVNVRDRSKQAAPNTGNKEGMRPNNKPKEAPDVVTHPAPQVSPQEPVQGLDKSYTNKKRGFSVKIPDGWIARDETAKMKPKLPGGFWIILSKGTAEKSPVVVNIRRSKLNPGTDADIFAKYNSYVQNWERKTVGNDTAFATMAGSPEAKRIVHRLIIIRNGSAWMLNCIDTSGKPAEESKQLFESMADSFSVL